MPSYTGEELERETGFSRRTIAYYVQRGLLPKVGRMGPKTRYPEQVRDRLRFIGRVRAAQEAGEAPPTSLREIRAAFQTLTPRMVAEVADGSLPVSRAFERPDAVHRASAGRRRDALRDRMVLRQEEVVAFYRPRPEYSSEDDDAVYDEEPFPEEGRSDLADLLAQLTEASSAEAPEGVQSWSRVEVSPGIALSAHGLGEEDQALLERAARHLRELAEEGRDAAWT